jgi:hypothetical protein
MVGAWLRTPRALVLAVGVLGACSTPRPGGIVGDPEKLSKGTYIDRSQADLPAIKAANLSALSLAEIDVSRVVDQDGITRKAGAQALRAGLLGSSANPDSIPLRGSRGAGTLDVAIVEMSIGSAVGRVMAGEVGVGHAWVQVDARVIDPKSGRILASLSDRRRSSGDIGFRDTFGSAGPALVREMLKASGSDIRRELDLLFGARLELPDADRAD